MNFALGEEISELRDTIHKFAQDRIRPQAQKIDKAMAKQGMNRAALGIHPHVARMRSDVKDEFKMYFSILARKKKPLRQV